MAMTSAFCISLDKQRLGATYAAARRHHYSAMAFAKGMKMFCHSEAQRGEESRFYRHCPVRAAHRLRFLASAALRLGMTETLGSDNLFSRE